ANRVCLGKAMRNRRSGSRLREPLSLKHLYLRGSRRTCIPQSFEKPGIDHTASAKQVHNCRNEVRKAGTRDRYFCRKVYPFSAVSDKARKLIDTKGVEQEVMQRAFFC